IDTEFGRKTEIHQASCNKDYSCLHGDCPSFITAYSPSGLKKPNPPELDSRSVPVPERSANLSEAYRIFMPGIGGTGVITVSHVLA
ncbi:hypothetical protein Q8G39_28510, partial [Klebsiella pneumoniae]|uniref:hypothetical protein n=1 Tax=Klebsiella pneumoniae TaxID=573 RepID=UPI0030138B30